MILCIICAHDSDKFLQALRSNKVTVPCSAHRLRRGTLTWRTSCKACKLNSALKIWSSQSSESPAKQQQPMLPARLLNSSQTRTRTRRGSKPCRPPHAMCCWLRCAVPTKGHTLPAAHHTNSQKALPLKHLLSISWEPCNSAYAVQGMPATTM